MSDFYAADVGDGVVRSGNTVEGDAQVAGSGLGLRESECGGAEESGQEREGTKSHHRSGSIVRFMERRRQYKAWLAHSRVFRGRAVRVEGDRVHQRKANHREHRGGTEDTGKSAAANLEDWPSRL